MLDDNQIYVIVDIETDGPVPGLYSMLSIGAVASTASKEVGSFYRKVLPYDKAGQDPDTMDWWKTQPEAWKEVTTGATQPEIVMREFCDWVKSLGAVPVFVAHPVAFDYTFVGWYLHRFLKEDPFIGHGGGQRILDLGSFTAGKLNLPLSRARRSQLAPSFRVGMPEHSHKAIDDARGYGVILRNVLKA